MKLLRQSKWQDCRKAWILPNGDVIVFEESCHRDHIVNHTDEYEKKFGLILPKSLEDTAVRQAAVEIGFTRINYQFVNGILTVETFKKYWHTVTRNPLIKFINVNAELIDFIRVNLFENWGYYTESFQNVMEKKNCQKSRYIPD